MDILTPKGQKTRQQEDRAIEIWLSHYPDCPYIHTPKDKPATVDAVLCNKGSIKAVVETKCRDFSYETFKRKFQGNLLISYEKIIKAADIASSMCVPLVVFLYMVEDDSLLYQKIWEPGVGWTCTILIRPTWTQATVNGGKALRSNAFIHMDEARLLKELKNG
jgi:hypothetical protein